LVDEEVKERVQIDLVEVELKLMDLLEANLRNEFE